MRNCRPTEANNDRADEAEGYSAPYVVKADTVQVAAFINETSY